MVTQMVDYLALITDRFGISEDDHDLRLACKGLKGVFQEGPLHVIV